jgi:hypothetical protein
MITLENVREISETVWLAFQSATRGKCLNNKEL